MTQDLEKAISAELADACAAHRAALAEYAALQRRAEEQLDSLLARFSKHKLEGSEAAVEVYSRKLAQCRARVSALSRAVGRIETRLSNAEAMAVRKMGVYGAGVRDEAGGEPATEDAAAPAAPADAAGEGAADAQHQDAAEQPGAE